MSNDEYQYPNQEYVTETTPSEEQETELKRINFFVRFVQNNKRITFIIGLVLIVLIAFKVMNSHKATNVDTAQLVVAAQPQPVVTQLDPEMLCELNALKQGEKNSQAAIGQLPKAAPGCA